MPAISVKGVSKRFRIFPSGRDRLKEVLSLGRRKYGRDFWALDGIDLEVEPGTTLGIVGRNGAGKSTLLNIISGILQPTTGSIEINGRLVAIYGVGAGFDSEFSGRENVILNGLILGMEYREIVERFDEIAALADLGHFMEQPIKTYSSGMRSRLGFAVAANVQPDILILDEVFAVGDAVYKETALQKMYELRDSGTTILFVSHGMETVREFCTEAVLLHEGQVLEYGEATEVVDSYHALVSSIREQREREETDGEGPEAEDLVTEEDHSVDGRAPRGRGGPTKVRIRKVELLNKHLHPIQKVKPDSTVTIRVHLEYLEDLKDSEIIISLGNKVGLEQSERQESQFYGPNLGYVLELYEKYGEDPESVDEGSREFFETWSPPQVEANGHAPAIAGELFSASTTTEGVPLKEMEKGEQVVVDFTFKVPLRRGHYSITAAARTGSKDLHRVEAATTFRITHPQDSQNSLPGLVHLPTDIKVHAPEGERQGQSA
jgi:ABC-type polysaccharide/polyol phosphate transport system ATPase subunit